MQRTPDDWRRCDRVKSEGWAREEDKHHLDRDASSDPPVSQALHKFTFGECGVPAVVRLSTRGGAGGDSWRPISTKRD